MIRITVFKDSSGDIQGFKTEGHAGAGEYGHDIVCSAVSALEISTANGITELTGDGDMVSIDTDEDKGRFTLRFNGKPGKDSQLLLRSLVLGFASIEEDHPDNVKLYYREV